MNIVKLKKLFIICLLGLILLIIIASCNVKEIIKKEENIGVSDINVSEVHNLGNFNYNNLTNEQKNYFYNIYSNRVIFTKRGVEIYFGEALSRKVR